MEGDSNTSFFHKCANGRKRKSTIHTLEEGDTVLTENDELRRHITKYYKKLFDQEEPTNVHLHNDSWSETQKITLEENEELTKPFSMEELEAVVKDMKNGTAPGPDGFSVEFFKEFLPQMKEVVKEMLDDRHTGHLDLWRLNYGVIILIPKIKLPNNVKQFRPIFLLNIIYKIITKVLTMRLTKVASRVISNFQTAFIPDRNILDGIVILHETLHSLEMQKEEGIILKLDFEKAYDRVSWTFLEEILVTRNFSPT